MSGFYQKVIRLKQQLVWILSKWHLKISESTGEKMWSEEPKLCKKVEFLSDARDLELKRQTKGLLHIKTTFKIVTSRVHTT